MQDEKVKNLKKISVRNRAFGAIIAISGITLLCYVDWKIALGAFLLTWGNNLEFSSKIIYRLGEMISQLAALGTTFTKEKKNNPNG